MKYFELLPNDCYPILSLVTTYHRFLVDYKLDSISNPEMSTGLGATYEFNGFYLKFWQKKMLLWEDFGSTSIYATTLLIIYKL